MSNPRSTSPSDLGVTLPGLVNAHSHAFHRLLRGRTHRQGGDFWLWRDAMYEIAGRLTPESYERVATAVYVEMALAGITAVGEFHYLHHQAAGVPYDDPNEMAYALIRAAKRAGIRICLLDVGYFTAGFADRELDPVQERFRDASPHTWLDRASDLADAYAGDEDVVVGLAPHSVRAVPAATLELVSGERQPGAPVHIHVSEQPAENQECLAATGLTPTQLISESGLMGPDTTFVHATHLTTQDIELIGSTETRVCYCTTTERDLADGIGPAALLSAAGTDLCVGTDSHAVIDIFEEARGMEMHQRLATGKRGVMSPDEVFAAATTNGATALGFDPGGTREGAPVDRIILDPNTPRLAGIGAPNSIDSVVFAATAADVTDVFVGGRPIVSNGVHPLWETVRADLNPPFPVL